MLFFPLGVWLPQRSAAAAKAGADPVLASRPDPEVVAIGMKRNGSDCKGVGLTLKEVIYKRLLSQAHGRPSNWRNLAFL